MMGQDADKTESEDAEKKPLKIKAEDNPWYLLATLDDPNLASYELWNYYFTASPDEDWTSFKEGFAKRCAGKNLELPDREADIDFSNIEFDHDVSFRGFVFTKFVNFEGTTFSGRASFGEDPFHLTSGVVFAGVINQLLLVASSGYMA